MSYFTVGYGVILLTGLWFLVCSLLHGYANTIDTLAFWLHKHAQGVRKMHGERTEVVLSRWDNDPYQ